MDERVGSMKKAALLFMLMLVLLVGCANPTPTEVVVTEVQPPTSVPKPTQTPALAILERVTLTPGIDGGLAIKEHPLKARGEDVESVLAEYEDAEWSPLPRRPVSVEVGGDIISFREKVIPAEEEVENAFLLNAEVALFINDEPLMTIPIGTLKAGSIVYGIYTDGSSWYLEVDRGEAFYREDGTLRFPIQGDIYRDGVSLNETEGYDESFGFAIMKGFPFYFFVRDGTYYYRYLENDYALTYTRISHHMCCSGSLAEPRRMEDQVVFFADRGDQRYLVILGGAE
jgi:hypothetical protein